MPSIFLLIFIPVSVVVVTSLLLLNRHLAARRRDAMKRALLGVSLPASRPLASILMEPGKVVLRGFLADLNLNRKLDLWIRQAGVSWTPRGVVSAMAVCAACGAILGTRLHGALHPAVSIVALAVAAGLAPLIPLLAKRRKRLSEFEQQLPDALDFLARAMRAGHAFGTSLKIMADESPDPLGQEFRKLYAEHNLGAPLADAFEALMSRVPLLDLQFFAAAVTLQRETGGNLSEVILKLSAVIRERFALRGKVRATSAQGRLTGLVLAAMPVCMAVFLTIVSPDYLGLLEKDPLGKYLILAAVAGQILGYIVIRRIVDFEV